MFHRNHFCKDYLSKIELQCHWLIQLTKETAENWKREKGPSEFNKYAKGHAYLSDDDIQMVEFHIYNYNFLYNVANEMGTV